MSLTAQIAKHFREVHIGGNWTSVNLKDSLADVSWQQATTKLYSFNSIAALVYHINYYVSTVLKVLQGNPLSGHDKFSFDCPPVCCQADWDNLVSKSLADAEQFAQLLEQMPDSKLSEDFTDKKYGNYYRNMLGIIEHCHYHLGQIVILKKILASEASTL